MAIRSKHQGFSMRMVALVAVIPTLALGAVIFGGAFIPRAHAQGGAMSAPTLTSDTSGTIVVSWEVPSPEPSDYRVDWAKSSDSYTS